MKHAGLYGGGAIQSRATHGRSLREKEKKKRFLKCLSTGK